MSNTSLKIGFAGTPEFAASALFAMIANGFIPKFILSQPDRPAGRGMRLQTSPVKQLALEHDIEVLQPQSLRFDGRYAEQANLTQNRLNTWQPDVLVVVAYGLILPTWILRLPKHGCLNIHASLLPRWRGAAPIHRAIQAGDCQTGIGIMQMDEGLDTGQIVLEQKQKIYPNDTTGSLHDRLADLGAQCIVSVLQTLQTRGRLDATPQKDDGVVYAHKIEKTESSLDWRKSAQILEREIRAFNPYPVAKTFLGSELIKVWQAHISDMNPPAGTPPGSVLHVSAKDGIVVACDNSALALTQLQRAGGKRLGTVPFLQGFQIVAGDLFSNSNIHLQKK